MRPRYPELDLLRTIAILGMIVFHTAFDLDVFFDRNVDIHMLGWKLLQLTTASLFLLLVGMGAAIASRTPWRRFFVIGAAAMIVTAATFVMDPETYVRFGILHLISVSALLMPLIRPLREAAAIVGIICIGIGLWISSTTIDSSLLLPLGIVPYGFRTVDYFPLFPWFGVICIGFAIGHLLYVRQLRPAPTQNHHLLTLLGWPGRYALWIYLLHQPIILAILWASL